MKSLKEDSSANIREQYNNPDEMSTDDNVTLTSNAFQFLLWSRRLQIWFLILKLLEFSYEVE